VTLRGWLAPYLVLTVVWGASFLFIEVGLTALTPGQVAFSRVLLGALALLAVLVVTRSPLPRGWQIWKHLAIVGLTFNALPFLLFAWAQTHISSILAGIWNATTPLWTVLMGLVLFHAVRPTRHVMAGLALGFVGVVVVLGPWTLAQGRMDADLLLGTAAALAATAGYGFAATYTGVHLTGRPDGRSPAQYPAVQLLVATGVLAVVVIPQGQVPTTVPMDVALALAALGVLGTGLAYVLLYRVVAVAGAVTATTVTYLIPLVSTTLGIVALGESLTWNEPVGAVLVLVGAWLTRPRAAGASSVSPPPGQAPRSG
jgi:drug/metabolite transporter (DMT)-like permease